MKRHMGHRETIVGDRHVEVVNDGRGWIRISAPCYGGGLAVESTVEITMDEFKEIATFLSYGDLEKLRRDS